MAVPEPADLDRRRWTKARPRLGDASDIANLFEAEQRLEAVERHLEDVDNEQAMAEEAAAQAQVAWEKHLAEQTLQLHADGVRSSEDLRRALALANTSVEGIPGDQLFEEMVATKSVVDTLHRSIKVAETRTSALQTLIRGIRQATGVDP